jgi:hypothetical protein
MDIFFSIGDRGLPFRKTLVSVPQIFGTELFGFGLL